MDGIIKSAEENKSYQLSTNPNQPAILTEEEIKKLKIYLFLIYLILFNNFKITYFILIR